MQYRAPDLIVASALEEDVRYGQLQVMADELLRDDLVAAQSGEAQCARWREIDARVDAMLADCRDVRLHLLRYRATLATRGVLAAGAMLDGWADAAAQRLPSACDDDARAIIGTTFVHFFTESHLRELQAATLHVDGGPAVRAVFECAAARRREEGGRGKSAPTLPSDQKRLAITQWLQSTPDVLARVHAMRGALNGLAGWLREYEPMVPLVRRERTTSWLARLQDALILLGATGDPEPVMGSIGGHIPASSGDTMVEQAAVSAGAAPGNGNGGAAIPLDLERMRRVDVAGLLQLCVRWFAQNEPGSPAPYFINRAIVLMNADFQEILRNLLPDTLPHFHSLTGIGDRS